MRFEAVSRHCGPTGGLTRSRTRSQKRPDRSRRSKRSKVDKRRVDERQRRPPTAAPESVDCAAAYPPHRPGFPRRLRAGLSRFGIFGILFKQKFYFICDGFIMRVLIVTHAASFRTDRIVSGNAVRAHYFGKGLVKNGIDVTFAYPKDLASDDELNESAAGSSDVRFFGSRSELHELIDEVQPKAVLVGYWELLEHFPDDYEIPLVADIIAPRILEALFQDHQDVNLHASKMLALYRKASRFICGTQRQREFLIPWLILAGFDCRFGAPIDIIPISTEPLLPRGRANPTDPWVIVTGGVSWPWRMGVRYTDAIRAALADGGAMKGRLLLLSGGYVHENPSGSEIATSADADAQYDATLQHVGLLPYGDMERLFSQQCDIGIELSDYSIERDFSASFRSIEFLRCGLPVICNHTLELARQVADNDAGWVIEDPEDLPALLAAIAGDPLGYDRKSANAIRLVEERYHYLKTIVPLVDYLRDPKAPEKTDDWFFRGSEKLALNLYHQVSELDQQLRIRYKQITDLRREGEGLKAQLDEVLGSASWRLIQPVRNLARRLVTFKSLLLRAGASVYRRGWKHPGPRKEFAAESGRYAPRAEDAGRDQWFDRKGRYVAILSREDVFPTNHGAAVKVERTAWGLSHFVDGVFLITGDWGRYYVFKNGSATEKYFPLAVRLSGVSGMVLRKRLLRTGIPINEAYIYQALFDWGYFVRLMYLALRYRIVLYQAEFPAYAQACVRASRLLSGKTLLVEHNVECDRIKAQYPEVSSQAYAWLRDQEVSLCNQVDKVVAVSKPDRDLLIGHGVDPGKVHVIPHGVDLGAFEHTYEFRLREAYQVPADTRIILYHGIYSYKPNLEAVHLLAKEILPRLRVRGWKAKVFAIGPEAPLEAIDPDVVFTGAVDRLAPYLKSGDVAVVPLQQGGGTRMKLLEYFAASIPVVTTSKGVEGIPAEKDSQVFIEDTFDGMANAVIWLFEHPEEGAAMAERAQEIIARSDWKSIADQYLRLLN
jgi:glycosyltransferase involved in cell wall biosynthesis